MRRLTPDDADTRFIRRAAMLALLVGLAAFLYAAIDLLLLVFAAAMGAVLLSGIADAIARATGWRRGIGFGIAVALLLGAFGFTGWLFGDQLGREFGTLVQRLPQDWAALHARLEQRWWGHALVDGLAVAAGGKAAAAIAAKLGLGLGEGVVDFIIVLVGAIFLAAQPGLYHRGIVLLAPPSYRGVVSDALDDGARTLRRWLLTQAVLMTSMGVLVGVGLWLAGLQSAAALGLLAGLSEFIPYVGPTAAMVPPLVIALAGAGSWEGVIATFVGVRMIQSNFITPLVQRRLVSVPPAVTLFAILSFGYAFGTFGLFFSAPLLVVAYTLVGRIWLRETLGDDIVLPGECEDEGGSRGEGSVPR